MRRPLEFGLSNISDAVAQSDFVDASGIVRDDRKSIQRTRKNLHHGIRSGGFVAAHKKGAGGGIPAELQL